MSKNTTKLEDVLSDFLSDPEFKAEYDALKDQYNLASQLIAIRAITRLTQREFAQRVSMKQSQLARIESGNQIPKLETIARLAAGAGYRIEVNFIPLNREVIEEIKPIAIAVPNNVEIPPSKSTSILEKFLSSEDETAVALKKWFGRSLNSSEVEFLEKCLNLPSAEDKFKAIDNLLAESGSEANLTRSNSRHKPTERLKLAKKLLKKLDSISE